MVNCYLCGKSFKVITPSHLKSHGVTLQEYRERFPDAPIYSDARYRLQRELASAGPITCPVCGRGMFDKSCCQFHGNKTLEELGLLCLQRYDKTKELPSETVELDSGVIRLQAWSKKTRERIEDLFR